MLIKSQEVCYYEIELNKGHWLRSITSGNFHEAHRDLMTEIKTKFEDKHKAHGRVFITHKQEYGFVHVRVYETEEMVKMDERLTSIEDRLNHQN